VFALASRLIGSYLASTLFATKSRGYETAVNGISHVGIGLSHRFRAQISVHCIVYCQQGNSTMAHSADDAFGDTFFQAFGLHKHAR
jgi:hypothetical protein